MSPGLDVDLDELRPILQELGFAKPSGLAELAGGSHPSYRIDLADGGAVVLKTYDELRAKMPTREAYAASLLAGLDLPVTRYLAIDESRTRLPFRFAITNYLPGQAARTLRGEFGIESVYREMGALLRRLHEVRMPAYGNFTEAGMSDPTYATNEARVRSALSFHLSQFRKYGADESLASRLEAAARNCFEISVPSTGAVFAHDDLHPGNVVVMRDADGRLKLTGLLDLGNAHAADPVWDLAKILFINAHEAPNSPPLIREGYGPIDHPDPEGAIWFYTLMHRVIMWWWLRHVGTIGDGKHDQLIDDLRQMVDGPAR